MPLNPDGTMTAQMPSIAELTGIQPRTSGGGNGRSPSFRPPAEKAEKRQYQPFEAKTFPVFARAKFAYDQSQLGADAKPASLADTATILDYANQYADTYLPGVILANHGLENKDYLATIKNNFLIDTHEKLDKLKKHFKSQEPQQPPTPPGISAGDWAKYLAGKAIQGTGESVAGALRSVGDPLEHQLRPVMGLASPYVAKGLENLPFGLGEKIKGYEATAHETANRVADSANQGITQYGEDLANETSPAFQQATSKPLLSREGFTLPNVTAKVTGGLAQSAPQIAAAAATGGASLVPGFAAQTAESSRRQELARVMDIPDEELVKLAPIQEMLQHGIPLPMARGMLAQKSADTASQVGTYQGAAMGALPGTSLLKGATGSLRARILKNATTQIPLFGGVGAASQAANTLATNPVTGEDRNPLQGTGEAAVQGAVQAIPFLGAKAHNAAPKVTASEVPAGKVKSQLAEAAPVETAAMGEVPQQAVASAVQQAFSEVPAPEAKALGDAGYVKSAYQQWADTVRADLEGAQDFTEKQVNAIEPQLKQLWAKAVKVDPAMLEDTVKAATPTETAPVPANTTAAIAQTELEKVPNFSQRPEEAIPLSTGEVRSAAEGSTVLKDRLSQEIAQTLGREPTPEESNQLTQQVTDELANQPGVNVLLPKALREEAINQLVGRKKELPTPEEINSLAAKLNKEIGASKENGVLKKKSQEEPSYLAKDDISVEPTGRSTETVRQALAEKIGEKATKALEDSGLLKLVQSKADLPEAYRGEGTVSGVYTPERRAYLVADHITPGAEWRTLVHEAGVHYGMRQMLPEPLYKTIEDHIQEQLNKDTPEGQEITAAWNSAEAADTNPLIQTNETIAHMVQSRLAQVPGSLWNRALTSIRAFAFDKIGQYLPKSVAKKLLDNATITQLAKSATGRAAELRTQDIKAQAADAMDIPAYNQTLHKAIEANTFEKVSEAISIREKPPERESTEIERMNSLSWAQEKATKIYNDLYPLKFLNEKLAAKGIKVDRDANMLDEATRFQARKRHSAVMAELQYVEPTLNWFSATADKLGKNPVQFVNELTNWYQGKRSLEVNERADLEDSGLIPDAEKARALIKQQWMHGELPDGQYLQKLREVVNKAGARIPGAEALPASAITSKTANLFIAKARKAGITEEVINGFEPFRQEMVNIIVKNGLASKRFSSHDEVRRSGLGSKYYVPLKGFGEGEKAARPGVDYEGPKLGAFTKEYEAASGRGEKVSQNPLLSLMQDVIRSAQDVPENEFTKSVYNFVKKYGKELGATVESRNIEKEMREAAASGKTMTDLAQRYNKSTTVVHNAGNYRFFMHFPEDSAIVKSIKSLRSIDPPGGKLQELAKKVTNGQGYLATVTRPSFLIWNMGWNDFFGNLSQVYGDHGVGAAMDFAKNYWKQGGWFSPGAWSHYLKGGNALQREQLSNASNASRFAKIHKKFVDYGGDLSFDQMLNATGSPHELFNQLEKASGPLASAKEKLDAGLAYLEKAGNVSNMVGRVAAYETYVKYATKALEKSSGRKLSAEETTNIEKDAVLYSRRLLDFLQTGETGRAMNAHFMFARVALTQADRIANTFRTPEGKWDLKKMAITLATANAASAVGYALMSEMNPELQKQSDDTVASKFLIPTGNGQFIEIPMGYGLSRLLLVPGIMATRWALGHTDAKSALKTIGRTYVENLTPFKPSANTPNESTADQLVDLLEAGTPSYLRPLVQLARNKTVFGSSISTNPTYVDDKMFRSDSPRSGTPPEWTWLAQTMREVSGGSVDTFPESLEFLAGSYLTGPANDIMRTVAALERKSQGLDIEPQKLPFAPSIFSNDADYYEQRKLKEARNSLLDESKQMNYAKKQGPEGSPKREKAIQALKRAEPGIEKKLEVLKEIDGLNRGFNKDRKEIESNVLLSPTIREQKVKQLADKFKQKAAMLTKRAEGL